jgi:AhpD family alkylhydroperoxidase
VTPRLPLPTRRETGTIGWLVSAAAGRIGGTQSPRLFLTMSLRPRLFRGWLRFAGRLMPGGRLPRRETELVILRVAQLRDCAYELEHHRHLAARAGITETDISRLTEGPDAAGWSARERLVLRAVEDLHQRHDIDDALWAELSAVLTPGDLVELILLVGHYEMLATFVGTFRIPPDRRRSSVSSPAAAIR